MSSILSISYRTTQFNHKEVPLVSSPSRQRQINFLSVLGFLVNLKARFGMAFSVSSKDIRLSNSKLSARCRKMNAGPWVWSTIDLNNCLGNQDGTFDMESVGWYGSAVHENTNLYGLLLRTILYNRVGKKNEACLNLDLCIANIDGVLTFKGQKPNDSILMSVSCLMLSYTTLKAICIGNDGMCHASEIDLNSYYGNRNSEFVSDDKHFVYTARNISLNVANSSIKLNAELKDYDHVYQNASVDLAICVVNKNGHLIFEKHDGWFDRDGFWTKFFEHAPLIGFIVAAIQEANGNHDQAVRAIVVCANSTIVCAGIVICTWFGGPLGGVVGAGLTTPIAILAEEKIVKLWETNPGLKAQFEEATIGRYIYETLRNMAAAGLAGYFAEWLESLAASELDSAMVIVLKHFGSKLAFPADFGVYVMMKKIADALRGNSDVSDWDKSIKDVDDLLIDEANAIVDFAEGIVAKCTGIDVRPK